MTKGIVKLSEEAIEFAVIQQSTVNSGGIPEFNRLYRDKFAELIVQECAGIITSQDVDPAFKNRMAWAIKEHFGVE